MFVEIITRSNEKVSINISNIISITPYRKGCIIFDVAGVDYSTKETYESVMSRISRLVTLN